MMSSSLDVMLYFKSFEGKSQYSTAVIGIFIEVYTHFSHTDAVSRFHNFKIFLTVTSVFYVFFCIMISS